MKNSSITSTQMKKNKIKEENKFLEKYTKKRKRTEGLVWMNTELRVVCSLKLFSSKADCSFVSLSFFLMLFLLVVVLSALFAFGYCCTSPILCKLNLSSLLWFTLLMASSSGQSSKARSREATGLFTFCFSLFGTFPAVPSPRDSPVMHSSSSSMIENEERERGREKWGRSCM